MIWVGWQLDYQFPVPLESNRIPYPYAESVCRKGYFQSDHICPPERRSENPNHEPKNEVAFLYSFIEPNIPFRCRAGMRLPLYTLGSNVKSVISIVSTCGIELSSAFEEAVCRMRKYTMRS